MLDKVRKVFEESDEFRVKWEQGNGADESWSTSSQKASEETCGYLA